jgi:calnexin
MIPDPEVKKPEAWDEDEDGEWVAPMIDNPKCLAVSGCGEWNPKLILNPNYKGPWVHPTIANPAYKGPWKPKLIPNPNFFEDLKPSKFTKMVLDLLKREQLVLNYGP